MAASLAGFGYAGFTREATAIARQDYDAPRHISSNAASSNAASSNAASSNAASSNAAGQPVSLQKQFLRGVHMVVIFQGSALWPYCEVNVDREQA
jgi:hypothetical protein